MSSPLTNRNVLVTGGTGTFGQAFVRHALAVDANRVSVLSRGEAKQAAMEAAISDQRMRFLIGDVRDANRMLDALRGVDIVVHAAALKRVEACEKDPNEAVATNVVGTQNVARACIERGVQRAVLLSTDKSAAPNTLYGATKLTAERLWLASNVYAGGLPTRFSATRYGNVASSTGSVIPTWKVQAQSGTVTVTHKDMTRFFMSIDDAVNLVTLALSEMRGGEVFIPSIAAARIVDLASVVAPGAQLREIGIRAGEKMHETLISEDEARCTFDCGSYFVIEPETRTWGTVAPLTYPKVSAGFTYRSDTAPQFTIEKLKELAA